MKLTKQTTFARRRFLLCLSFALCLLAPSAWAADGLTNNSAGIRPEKIVRVACVGDSITFGSGLTDRDHDAYPAVLGRWLGTGWDVRNFGVSGATLLNEGDKPYARETAHRDALAFAPDIVVIMLGTNDSKHPGDDSLGPDNHVDNWQFHARYLPEYAELIQEFRRANPKAIVYVCLPTPCFPGRWGISDRTIHGEVIPLVREAAQAANARIIDLNTPFTGKASLFPDTVHPDSAGAKLMAAIVYQTLTKRPAPASAP